VTVSPSASKVETEAVRVSFVYTLEGLSVTESTSGASR